MNPIVIPPNRNAKTMVFLLFLPKSIGILCKGKNSHPMMSPNFILTFFFPRRIIKIPPRGILRRYRSWNHAAIISPPIGRMHIRKN